MDIGELVDSLTEGWQQPAGRGWVDHALLARELVQFAIALIYPDITEHGPGQLDVWAVNGPTHQELRAAVTDSSLVPVVILSLIDGELSAEMRVASDWAAREHLERGLRHLALLVPPRDAAWDRDEIRARVDEFAAAAARALTATGTEHTLSAALDREGEDSYLLRLKLADEPDIALPAIRHPGPLDSTVFVGDRSAVDTVFEHEAVRVEDHWALGFGDHERTFEHLLARGAYWIDPTAVDDAVLELIRDVAPWTDSKNLTAMRDSVHRLAERMAETVGAVVLTVATRIDPQDPTRVVTTIVLVGRNGHLVPGADAVEAADGSGLRIESETIRLPLPPKGRAEFRIAPKGDPQRTADRAVRRAVAKAVVGPSSDRRPLLTRAIRCLTPLFDNGQVILTNSLDTSSITLDVVGDVGEMWFASYLNQSTNRWHRVVEATLDADRLADGIIHEVRAVVRGDRLPVGGAIAALLAAGSDPQSTDDRDWGDRQKHEIELVEDSPSDTLTVRLANGDTVEQQIPRTPGDPGRVTTEWRIRGGPDSGSVLAGVRELVTTAVPDNAALVEAAVSAVRQSWLGQRARERVRSGFGALDRGVFEMSGLSGARRIEFTLPLTPVDEITVVVDEQTVDDAPAHHDDNAVVRAEGEPHEQTPRSPAVEPVLCLGDPQTATVLLVHAIGPETEIDAVADAVVKMHLPPEGDPYHRSPVASIVYRLPSGSSPAAVAAAIIAELRSMRDSGVLPSVKVMLSRAWGQVGQVLQGMLSSKHVAGPPHDNGDSLTPHLPGGHRAGPSAGVYGVAGVVWSELVARVRRVDEALADDAVAVDTTAMCAALGADLPEVLSLSVSWETYARLLDAGWTRGPGGRLVRDGVAVSVGWAGVSHVMLGERAWSISVQGGPRVACLPDTFARMQETGDDANADRIRAALLDPARPPLPAFVLRRELAAIREVVPAELLSVPNADRAVLLAANGVHIARTLYGDPDIGRANQIIGSVDAREFLVPATWHHGARLVAEFAVIVEQLRLRGAAPAVMLRAMVAHAYAGTVFGYGRLSDAQRISGADVSSDEALSARLLRAHAVVLGAESTEADELSGAVLGVAAEEATGDESVQAVAGVGLHGFLARDGVLGALELAVENLFSPRDNANPPGAVLIRRGVRVLVRSTRGGLEVLDRNGYEHPEVWAAFIDFLDREADFVERGYRYPPVWTLENQQLRRWHAAMLRTLVARLRSGEITASQAYDEAQRHAVQAAELAARLRGLRTGRADADVEEVAGSQVLVVADESAPQADSDTGISARPEMAQLAVAAARERVTELLQAAATAEPAAGGLDEDAERRFVERVEKAVRQGLDAASEAANAAAAQMVGLTVAVVRGSRVTVGRIGDGVVWWSGRDGVHRLALGADSVVRTHDAPGVRTVALGTRAVSGVPDERLAEIVGNPSSDAHSAAREAILAARQSNNPDVSVAIAHLPDPRRPLSLEEQDFLDWYRARYLTAEGERNPYPGIRRQGLLQRAAMTGIDEVQMRRWLPGIRVNPAVVDDPETSGEIPDPARYASGRDWLAAMRWYLALREDQMDLLLRLDPGTWAAIESGAVEQEQITRYVRALLRNVPEARSAYDRVGRQFSEFGLLNDQGQRRWPEGYEDLHEYLKFLREQAGTTQVQFAEDAEISLRAVASSEQGQTKSPKRDVIDAYLGLGGAVTYADLAECFDQLPVDADQLRFPGLSAVESLREYVEYLRRVNHFTRADTALLAELLGVAAGRVAGFLKWPNEESTVLRIWRQALHRAGSWNDIALVWRDLTDDEPYRYRMGPVAGDVAPRPNLFDEPRDFGYSLRLYSNLILNRKQWASRTGLRVDAIAYAENGPGYSPAQLRTIHDRAPDVLPADALEAALNRFNSIVPSHYAANLVGLGRWLAALRDRVGLTQRQLAADTGHTAKSISRIENGGDASQAFLRQLCDVLAGSDSEVLWQQARDHFFPPADTTPAHYTANLVGFGAWLAALRNNAGWTQEQLAVASGRSAGSQRYIYSVEIGEQDQVSPAAAHSLCVALGVSNALWQQARAYFFPVADTSPAHYPADRFGLGQWLVALRGNADLTQDQLAEAAGVSPSYIGRIENGGVEASAFIIYDLCVALDVAPELRDEGLRWFFRGRFRLLSTDASEHIAFGYGSWLAALRRNARLTQRQLAPFAGASANYVSLIENGQVRPRRSVARALAVATRVLPEATVDRDLPLFDGYRLFDTTPSNHTLGSWLRAHLHNAGMIPAELASAARLSYMHVSDIVHDEGRPSLEMFRRLCDALDIHGSERIQAARYFYRDRYQLMRFNTDPREHVAFGFGSWLWALRHNAGMTQGDLVAATGDAYARAYIPGIENGVQVPRRRTARALAVATQVFPEATVDEVLPLFDEYRLVDTTPGNHTLGSWVRAHLRNAGLTAVGLATAVSLYPGHVAGIVQNRHTPPLPTFLRICDAFNIYGPARIEAIISFFSDRYPRGAVPDDERDFWLLANLPLPVAGEPDAQQQVRDQIYDRIFKRYAGIPRLVVRRCAPQWGLRLLGRDRYEQIAATAMRVAIGRHIPTSPFLLHALANCRYAVWHAAVGALLEGYAAPDRRRARQIVPAVVRHLVHDPEFTFSVDYLAAAESRADDTAAAVTRNRPDLALTRDDVIFVLGLLSQRILALGEPRSAEGDDETLFEADVRRVLAGLPNPDAATQLVLLVFQGLQLDQAAERVVDEAGRPLSLEDAEEIIATATPLVRPLIQSRQPTDDAPPSGDVVVDGEADGAVVVEGAEPDVDGEADGAVVVEGAEVDGAALVDEWLRRFGSDIRDRIVPTVTRDPARIAQILALVRAEAWASAAEAVSVTDAWDWLLVILDFALFRDRLVQLVSSNSQDSQIIVDAGRGAVEAAVAGHPGISEADGALLRRIRAVSARTFGIALGDRRVAAELRRAVLALVRVLAPPAVEAEHPDSDDRGESSDADADALRGLPDTLVPPSVAEGVDTEEDLERKRALVEGLVATLAGVCGGEPGDFVVDGLLDARTGVSAVEDVFAAVEHMVGRYPSRDLGGVRVVDFGDDSVDMGRVVFGLDGRGVIELNGRFVWNPELLAATGRDAFLGGRGRLMADVADDPGHVGYHVRGTGRVVYDAVVHEYGELLDGWLGRVSGRLGEILRAGYAALPDEVRDRVGYEEWVGQLPGYAFADAQRLVLVPGEAVAEAFRAIEINGARPGSPQQVIHDALVELLRVVVYRPGARGPPAVGASASVLPLGVRHGVVTSVVAGELRGGPSESVASVLQDALDTAEFAAAELGGSVVSAAVDVAEDHPWVQWAVALPGVDPYSVDTTGIRVRVLDAANADEARGMLVSELSLHTEFDGLPVATVVVVRLGAASNVDPESQQRQIEALANQIRVLRAAGSGDAACWIQTRRPAGDAEAADSAVSADEVWSEQHESLELVTGVMGLPGFADEPSMVHGGVLRPQSWEPPPSIGEVRNEQVQLGSASADVARQAERPLDEADEIEWEREEGVEGRIGSEWQPQLGEDAGGDGEPAGVSLTLANPDDAEVGQVRHRVTGWLAALGWLDDDQLDSMELVVTELVTNAVRYGAGRVQVMAEAGGGGPGERVLRIRVADYSRRVPRLANTGWTLEAIDEWDESQGDLERGQGMLIMRAALESLNLAWGYTVEGAGKTVFVELFENTVPERVPMFVPGRSIRLSWSDPMRTQVSGIREFALRHGWSQRDARRDSADALKAVSALMRADGLDREHPAWIVVEVLDDQSGRWLRVTVADGGHELPDGERLQRYRRFGVDLDSGGRRRWFDIASHGGGGAHTDQARGPPGSGDTNDDARGPFVPAVRPTNGEPASDAAAPRSPVEAAEQDRLREENAADTEFGDALQRARASGEPEVRTLQSSTDRQVELQTFPNGFQVQAETYRDASDAREAVVMFQLAQAIGAPVGQPYQYDPLVVIREYQSEPAPDSPEGRLFGLYEVLAGRDGPHARYFRDAASGEFKDHELPLSEIFRIRQQVAAQVNEFRAMGHGIGSFWQILRDLAEIERHALHTPAERRARDGLTRDARKKFDLLEEMGQPRYPELVGFDHPYVPADAVTQVKRAVDDFMAEHRERVRLGQVTIDLLPPRKGRRNRPYGRTLGPGRDRAAGCTIKLDLGWVASAGRMQSAMSHNLRKGYHPRGTGKAVYDVMMHEFGHVMNLCAPDYVVETVRSGNIVSSTGQRIATHLEDVLRHVHRQLVDNGLIGGAYTDYDVWIQLQPRYAFRDEAKTSLNAREAIGEGVEAVQINGGIVGSPQWVIHHYTTTGRIPVVTDDLQVHLPPAPAQPDQFRLPDWQATRRVLQDMYGRDIADHPALRGEDVSPAELASAFSSFRRIDRDRVTPEALGRYLLDSPAETTILLADVQYSGDGYSFDDGWLSLATSRGGQITDPRTGELLPGAEIACEPGVIRYIVGFRPGGIPFNPIPQPSDTPDANDHNRSTNRAAANEDGAVSSAAATAELGERGGVITYRHRYGSAEVVDRRQGLGVWAELDPATGVLRFEARRGEGTPATENMFADMMADLGERVRVLEVVWATDTPGTAADIDLINEGVREVGCLPEDTARYSTVCGVLAARFGYSTVSIDPASVQGSPGRMDAGGGPVRSTCRPDGCVRRRSCRRWGRGGVGCDSRAFRRPG